MGFADFSEQQDVVQLLQRSLARGRLAHAYLFSGPDLAELEKVARTLAKTLNCQSPPQRAASDLAVDCCDACLNCRKIEGDNHPDVLWVRPESRLRVITIDQMRGLMQTIFLKPTQAETKLAVVVAADRLNAQAANAFLKTLEEPPADSVIVLLSTAPERILETILSRCLRLNFSGELGHARDPRFMSWLQSFAAAASVPQKSLLGRYALLSVLLNQLTSRKETITGALTERSPLERYDDADPALKEKWEDELKAAIEAEYRRQRADLLTGLQWWLRDVWLATLKLGAGLLTYHSLSAQTVAVAGRISTEEAMSNLQQIEETQQLLATNVQEALALEVGLLKLRL